jgi:dipeptidyl aminopeptidase/acylaminoacyl peptidase
MFKKSMYPTALGESYEMVDSSELPGIDLEEQRRLDDNDGSDALDPGVGSTNASDDEGDSPGSTTSSLFEEIAELSGGNADDFSTSPSFILKYQEFVRKKSSKLRWVIIGLFTVILIVSWVYILVSSSFENTAHSYPIASTTIGHSTGPTHTSTTRQPTKPIIPLKEYDIHELRTEIATRTFNGDILNSDIVFLPSETFLPKDKDEGLHIVHANDDYVLRKLSDSKFQEMVHKSGEFEYKQDVYKIDKIILTYNLKYAIIVTDFEKLFRHSGLGNYWLYDLEKNTYTPIKDVEGSSKVQHASWSPYYNFITFIQDNNLYLFEVATKSIERITEDGSDDIYNGRPDWVYEEEVLSKDNALWWSPDETYVIYLKTDDSLVETLNLETFISAENYPKVTKIKYPKPGNKNPIVQLMQYSLRDSKSEPIDRSDSKLGEDYILYGGEWLDNEHFIIKETDRVSKILNYRLVNILEKSSEVSYAVNALDEYNGWIDNFGEMLVIPKNESANRETSGYIDVLNNNGYNHLGYFPSGSSKEPVFLTHGEWEVLDGPIKFDSESNLVYFTSNRHSSFEKQLYSVDLETKEWTLLTASPGEQLGYYEAIFSPSARYIIATREGPSFPVMYSDDVLSKREVIDFTGELRSYHKIEIGTDDKGEPITVNLVEKRPLSFNEDEIHPLLVSIYGGPGSQKTDVKFHISFEDNVSDKLNAVILYVDPRGTGGQGWGYRSWSTGNIGYYEPRDISTAVQKWIESRTYIDVNRTAIWGWSYGGFATLKTLEYDEGNVFKYGMAVAPVTDWLMYDSIYTERYMGLPSDNKKGYAESKVYKFEGLKKVKRFFLAHGTGDDNVHIQNTFRLLDNFNLHDVYNYDLQIFPDSNHNINYHNAYNLLMGRLLSWITNAYEGHFDSFH